jgi:Ca2+-binding RTX toxin-like protein
VRCGAGNDIVTAGPGDDTVRCGAGNDLIVGGPGRDVLVAGPGRDRLDGGPGDDRLNTRDRRPGDRADCGKSRDRALIDRGDRHRNCEQRSIGRR